MRVDFKHDVLRSVALALAFGCARAVASCAYTTSFGTVLGSGGHGLVAHTGFSLVSNVFSACVAFAVVAYALRCARRGAPCRLALPVPVLGASCVLLAIGFLAGTAGWFAALPPAAGLALCAAVNAAGTVVVTPFLFELFAAEPNVPHAVRAMVGGYLVQACAYGALSLLSGWPLCAVCLAVLAATFALARALRSQALADKPGSVQPLAPHEPARPLRATLRELQGSLLCVFVLTAVVGLLHTSVLGNEFESVIGAISMPLVLLLATVLLAGIVFASRRVPYATSVYRVVFPVMLTVLSLLPFASQALGQLAGAAMVLCYDIVGMAFVLLLLEVACGCTAPPLALIGIYQAGTHLSLVAGLALGLALSAVQAGSGASYATLLILACIYPLAMVLAYLSRRRAREAEAALDAELEGSAAPSPAAPSEALAVPTEEHAAQRVVRERVGERVTAFALARGLTPREAQVAVQLARGRTAGAIAADLGITENTAWAHIKHVYAKLGVHGKQDLIALIEREVIAG